MDKTSRGVPGHGMSRDEPLGPGVLVRRANDELFRGARVSNNSSTGKGTGQLGDDGVNRAGQDDELRSLVSARNSALVGRREPLVSDAVSLRRRVFLASVPVNRDHPPRESAGFGSKSNGAADQTRTEDGELFHAARAFPTRGLLSASARQGAAWLA